MCICGTLCVFVVPYVYLLYYVCIAVLTLDAGLLARSQYPEGQGVNVHIRLSGRSCDRPPRHRFFLVSLCLQATAEMVPKFPSCYYTPLM
jgi:hypothetical protein